MYAVCEFHLASLFSFRALHANAFAARTLPCPTPAGVKMALLAKLIERDGDARAQPTLDWLAPLHVYWRPPARIAISAATVHVLKSDAPDKGLKSTVGMREYAHAADPFALALGPIDETQAPDLMFAFGQLRALGNAESLVQPLAPAWLLEEVPEGFVSLTTEDVGPGMEGYAVVLDDLGTAPRWERLNVYRQHHRKLIPEIGPDRVRRIVTLPLQPARWTPTGYTLTLHRLEGS